MKYGVLVSERKKGDKADYIFGGLWYLKVLERKMAEKRFENIPSSQFVRLKSAHVDS